MYRTTILILAIALLASAAATEEKSGAERGRCSPHARARGDCAQDEVVAKGGDDSLDASAQTETETGAERGRCSPHARARGDCAQDEAATSSEFLQTTAQGRVAKDMDLGEL
jgi:hypothetical protein